MNSRNCSVNQIKTTLHKIEHFIQQQTFLVMVIDLRVVRVADTNVALNALAGYELGLTASIGGLSGTTDTAGLSEHAVFIKNDEDYESTTAASITGQLT